VKRNLILGLTLVLVLGGLSAEGAEPQGTKSARTAGAAVSAPTVVDKLVRTIPGLGRLVVADVPAAPKAPPVVFPNDVLDLGECASLMDPQVECRVHQPIGG
jgi:hypothetical protein